MGWAKHDDAVKAHHKALLETYGTLVGLLARGLKSPGLAPLFCRTLITLVKMRDSLRRNALHSQPIVIEKVLRALPPVALVLMRRNI